MHKFIVATLPTELIFLAPHEAIDMLVLCFEHTHAPLFTTKQSSRHTSCSFKWTNILFGLWEWHTKSCQMLTTKWRLGNDMNTSYSTRQCLMMVLWLVVWMKMSGSLAGRTTALWRTPTPAQPIKEKAEETMISQLASSISGIITSWLSFLASFPGSPGMQIVSQGEPAT